MKQTKLHTIILSLLTLALCPIQAAVQVPLGKAIQRNEKLMPKAPPAKEEFSLSRMEFAEAHWHGLEIVPITRQDRRQFLIPLNIAGVMIDEVTLEGTQCGFLGADIVESIEGYKTPNLKEFLIATMRVEERKAANMAIYRQGQRLALTLRAAPYYNDLGYANMEGGEGGIPGQSLTPFDTEMFISVPPTRLSQQEMNMLKQIDTQTGATPRYGNIGGKQIAGKLTLGEAILAGFVEPHAVAAETVAAELPIQGSAKFNQQQFTAVSTAAVSSQTEMPVAWMGLEVISVDDKIAQQYELTETHGVLVTKVEPRSPAASVGIKTEDIITKVGSVELPGANGLLKIVSTLLPGDETEVTVFRNGKQYEISLFMGTRPSPASMMKLKMVLVVVVFFIVYFLIFQDIFGHLLAFLIGSGVVLYLGDYYQFYSIGDALGAVNYSILIFIIGMNLISAVFREAGLFNYIAKKITLFTMGDRWKILMFFSLFTYVISCFMDNIATILMMVPMTLAMAKDLDFDPKPILVCQIIASNVGGASTMMGDFPNMLISLSTDLEFHDFVRYEMPVCIIIIIALLIYFKITQRKYFSKKSKLTKGSPFFLEIQKGLKTSITNMLAVKKGLIVLGLVIIGMILSGKIGANPAVIAFSGGIVLLFICGMSKLKIIKIVGIKDIIFFTCLFVMVGAAQASGILQLFARLILDVSNGNVLLITILMMWLAAGFGAFMNAGPTAALFIPVVMHLGIRPPHDLFWWALSLGVLAGSSCFLTSASGGPLASTLVDKFWKKHKKDLHEDSALHNLRSALSFREYAKMGMPIMLMILTISSVYLTVIYFW